MFESAYKKKLLVNRICEKKCHDKREIAEILTSFDTSTILSIMVEISRSLKFNISFFYMSLSPLSLIQIKKTNKTNLSTKCVSMSSDL